MAAPTLQKTWQFKVNQDLNTTGNWITDRQSLLRYIKDSLIDGVTFTVPWTVRGSSSGAVAAMDGVDRWTADGNVNWGSVAARATGSITTIPAVDINDTETFTLNDGTNPAIVFEFDKNGSVTPPCVAVDISLATTEADVRDAIIAAINGVGAGLQITASNGGAATVSLINDNIGTGGNQVISETVADSDFKVTDMSGGTSTTHSWIVLRQSGLGTAIDLLISCNTKDQGNNPRYLTVLVAVDGTGFTGGSTTADPTATATLKTMLQPTFATPSQDGLGDWMRGDDSNTFNCALHVLMSNDGQCTRVGVFVGGLPVLWIILDRVRNPVTSLALPIVACWISDYTLAGVRINDAPLWLDSMGTALPTYTETYPWRAGSMYHSGDFNVVFTTERVGSPTLPLEGAIPERLCKNDALDSYKYALMGIGIYSAASGKVGRHGAVYDLWFGDNCAPVGRGYPSDTAPNFVHWRHIVVPWNGTTMLTN